MIVKKMLWYASILQQRCLVMGREQRHGRVRPAEVSFQVIYLGEIYKIIHGTGRAENGFVEGPRAGGCWQRRRNDRRAYRGGERGAGAHLSESLMSSSLPPPPRLNMRRYDPPVAINLAKTEILASRKILMIIVERDLFRILECVRSVRSRDRHPFSSCFSLQKNMTRPYSFMPSPSSTAHSSNQRKGAGGGCARRLKWPVVLLTLAATTAFFSLENLEMAWAGQSLLHPRHLLSKARRFAQSSTSALSGASSAPFRNLADWTVADLLVRCLYCYIMYSFNHPSFL